MAIFVTIRVRVVRLVPGISIARTGLPPRSNERSHLFSSNDCPPNETDERESVCATSSFLSRDGGDEKVRDRQVRVTDRLKHRFLPDEQSHLRHAES